MLSAFQNIWMRSCPEMPQTQVYHYVVAVFLAKSMKHPYPEAVRACAMLSPTFLLILRLLDSPWSHTTYHYPTRFPVMEDNCLASAAAEPHPILGCVNVAVFQYPVRALNLSPSRGLSFSIPLSANHISE
jgi:hypothetical protein